MNKYIYDGPVLLFGKCIMNKWTAETMAISERKARSNFAYQFKTQYNKIASSKIELPGKIIMIN